MFCFHLRGAKQRGRFTLVRLCGTFPTAYLLDDAAAAVSGFSACLARTFLKSFDSRSQGAQLVCEVFA